MTRSQQSQSDRSCPLGLSALAAVLLFVLPANVAGNGMSVALQIRNETSRSQLFNAKVDQFSPTLGWKLDIDLDHHVCAAGLRGRNVISLSISDTQLELQNYAFVPGLGYLWSSTNYSTWQQANATCAAQGAVPAMPTSMQQAKKLVGLLNYGNAYPEAEWAWLGTTDYAQEGEWVTVKGIPLEQIGPFVWYSGSNEPNGGRRENCMVVHVCSAVIGDAPCDWQLPFACQMAP